MNAADTCTSAWRRHRKAANEIVCRGDKEFLLIRLTDFV